MSLIAVNVIIKKLLHRWALSQDCSNAFCPSVLDPIVREIEPSQRCTHDEHSCEVARPVSSNWIELEIKGRQRWTLRQDSGHNFSPVILDVIGAEIEIPKRCTLCQHSCQTTDTLRTNLARVLLSRSSWVSDPVDCPRTPCSTPAKLSGACSAAKSKRTYSFSVVIRHQAGCHQRELVHDNL